MSVQIKLYGVTADFRTRTSLGQAIFSGDYPSGGETIIPSDFKSPGKPPLWTEILGRYQRKYIYFIDHTVWKLRVQEILPNGDVQDILAGAYPAQVLSDKVEFQAKFPKF